MLLKKQTWEFVYPKMQSLLLFFLFEYEFCAILVVYRSLFWHTFWVGVQTKITLNFELVLGPKYFPGGHGFNNWKFYYQRIVALWSHKL